MLDMSMLSMSLVASSWDTPIAQELEIMPVFMENVSILKKVRAQIIQIKEASDREKLVMEMLVTLMC